jgi:PAS domain S-box-containing protein
MITISGKHYAQGIWRDITQLNKTRDDLRNERNRAQMYLDFAAVIFVVLDVTGKVTLINSKGCEILGRDESRIIGKYWFDCFVPDSCRDNARAAFLKLMKGKVRPVEYFENPVLRFDGQERIIAWHNTILRDEAGNITGSLSSGEDITERKLAEEKLRYNQERLKMLAAKLSLAEEQERHRIAMGIHDDLGQKLAVVKLHLQTLRESVSQKSMLAEIDIACNLTNEIIRDVRSLTFELSNPVLYEIGLEQALRSWLTIEIQNKTGLKCVVASDCDKLALDDDVKIVLFKAVRELMTNIVKHAQAKTAKVTIAKPDSHVVVTVEDDGLGFDVSKLGLPSSKEGGFGLFNIRQRLDFMGGRLDIDSSPGKGTRVVMTAPTKNSAPARQKKNPN